MRSAWRSGGLVLTLVGSFVAAAACSGKKDAAPSASCDGAAPVDGGVAPFGLDARPPATTCKVQGRPPLETNVAVTPAFPGLRFGAPTGLFQPPNEPDRWVVIEKGGGVKAFRTGATSAAEVIDFLVFPPNTIQAASEGGVLGLAFHPSWPTVPEVYLSYTVFSAASPANMRSVIARFRSTDGGKTLAYAPDVLLTLEQPYANHNGGGIAFGPDGMLYIGMGDGGSGGDPKKYGQNKDVLFGKFLRIDVDGTEPGKYRIPPTNPFANGGGRPEIYALGFRNPWRWSFDRATGELWAGDVGQVTWEEIDRVVLGGNYGWSVREGAHCFGATTCETAGLIDPVVEHDRSEARSITGGYVYRGTAIPSLVGTYVYGDFETGNVWALFYEPNGKPAPKVIANVGPKLLASFAEDAAGEIYAVRFDGSLAKLTPAGPPPPSSFPKKLSETGCVDPSDPKKPAESLVPYAVNAPLWSDGADKDRYLALPDGATITVRDDGDWDLPIGSVLVKTFRFGERLVETRLLMRHEDGEWGGYSYAWNDEQTDAELLPAGKVATIGERTWTFPSRSQCIQCHTKAAGGTLGLETGQLNGALTYPTTGRTANQLATLQHVGLLSGLPAADPSTLTCVPDPLGNEPLEARARAYLHANCSHCHRPEGGGRGTMDLRYALPLSATATCNEEPKEGPVGPEGSRLVVPGDPSRSILSLRMHAQDGKRMPPIGVNVVDEAGARVVDEWIRSLGGCP